ncbi:flavin-containing monooxygenase [Streptomyces sp. NPDC102279]|uniref:flavin-containing monooxygenase n=1 Tax=Streptomyces sp. NPDC102279 TaxID=3366153 RepID=UPI00380AE11A
MPTQESSPSRPSVDKEALRQKYAEERAKRLRSDGTDQYVRLADDVDHDPWVEMTPREPVHDHVTYTFIGGGWAGVLAGARLKEQGVGDVRIVDHAGDFGGVWHWNRYPGVMCDSLSLVYLPLLEETGHMPSERYVHGPEIREHFQRIGRHFSLYDNALFHTKVSEVAWQEENSRWLVSTNRGDRFTTTFLGFGAGTFSVPKLPDIPGVELFAGRSFHTSRWDYGYTGGSPEGAPMDKLKDKRVAVIGTGATGIQCVPELGRDAGELFVIQRTPTSVDQRNNGPIDPEWFQSISDTPDWQQRYHDSFLTKMDSLQGRPSDAKVEDLLNDGFIQIADRTAAVIKSAAAQGGAADRIRAALEESDFAKMDDIRARVDAVVEDRETADKLKAWYRQMCKRPSWHDEYLPTYNRPNVHLVDTDGKGVERVTERGVVVGGTEYEVDCIVYASGFDYSLDPVALLDFEVTGRDGLTLVKTWEEGMRTMHGIHVHGFPNMFIVQLAQGGRFGLNVPTGWLEAAQTIASVVGHALTQGHHAVEVTEEAQTAWVDIFLEAAARIDTSARLECTPGYYNNEGQRPSLKDLMMEGYPAGPRTYFELLREWRTTGRFEGLSFS